MIYPELKKHLQIHQYTWLVTGCAGFIGSNLLETLLNLNQKVVGLDNFSTGHQKNLDEVLKNVSKKAAENFQLIKGDIRNFSDCEKAMQEVDYTLHQAALGSVPRSIKSPELTHENNVDGFVNMLIAARHAGVKKFVYASSSSVYGDSPVLPKIENQIGNPLSPYAVSKYVNELYAHVFGRCYGMQTIGLRYFNVFGRRQDPHSAYAAVIPLWVSALSKHQPMIIFGDGKTSRDFCYVENVVQANLLAAFADLPKAMNRVYNIAVGEQTSLNELAVLLAEALNVSKPDIIHRDFRPGDIRHSLADISAAKTLLHYQPTHTISQGIAEAIEWYRSIS
ncbi:MAG: Vi polysaccharide biosynthesis protein VipB/TviC [Gammaproteobacteria bacterium RIFOXYB2_FULL_38_6]|nr:MAG: Vi polysaccharide biosynthesis protein VipB/TviC [Gammaproteobacteria bacterium RIFOXYB2_FULL_38_6]